MQQLLTLTGESGHDSYIYRVQNSEISSDVSVVIT